MQLQISKPSLLLIPTCATYAHRFVCPHTSPSLVGAGHRHPSQAMGVTDTLPCLGVWDLLPADPLLWEVWVLQLCAVLPCPTPLPP